MQFARVEVIGQNSRGGILKFVGPLLSLFHYKQVWHSIVVGFQGLV